MSAYSPPLTLFKKTCILSTSFFNLSDSSTSPIEVIKITPPTLKRAGGGGAGVWTMIILMLDANNRIIYTTDCHIQFNCRHSCVHMTFLLKLKICMDKTFLPWHFSCPLTNFLTFPEFPDPVETLSLLVGGNSKVTNQDLRLFINTHGNSTSFIRPLVTQLVNGKI